MSIRDPDGKYETIKVRLEDELLIYCARTDVNSEIKDKILYLIQNKVDWNYLLKLASRHRLLSLLYHNLNSICPELVPEDILKELKDKFNVNVRKNLMLTGELIKVLNLLESEGITAIPYKGPVLASMVYGNIGQRELDDLDIYIEKSVVLKINKMLSLKGYVPRFNLNEKMVKTYIRSQDELVLIEKDQHCLIEFHWKFSSNFFSFPFIPELLLSKNISEDILNGKNILTFSPEDTFLILAVHAAGHHWSRLAWLCDIAELIEKYNLDWDEIISKSNKLGVRRIIYVTIYLVDEILGSKFPKKIVNEIFLDKPTKNISIKIMNDIFHINLKSPTLIGWTYFHLKIRENLKHGIIDSIHHATVPSVEELRKLRLPYRLYPFYYVFKPFNLLKRFKLFKKYYSMR